MEIFLRQCVSEEEISAVKSLSHWESDDLKAKINAYDPHYIFEAAGDSKNPDKRKIICPTCRNGTGEDATPIEVERKNGVWLYHCFRDCGFQGDLMKIIADANNLNLHDGEDMYKALAIGANIISYPLPTKTTFDEETILIKADIAEAQTHLKDLPESQRRGLSLETLQHFGCGFLEKWTHPKNRAEKKKIFPTRRLIIPAGNHYNAVALPADRKNMDKNYHKMHAGNKTETFNSKVLYSEADLIVVVEGEIDAMSIWQAFKGKIGVVAVLGAGGYKNTLLPIIDKIKDKKFLILFDGDETGKKHSENLCGELSKRNIPAVARFFFDALTDEDKELFGTKVDANQIFEERGDQFLNDLVANIIQTAQIDFATVQETTTVLANFTEEYGEIDSDILPKLDAAKTFVNSLTKNNFKAANAYDRAVWKKIALLKFYTPSIAQKFFDTLKAVQKLSANIRKQIQQEIASLKKANEPVPIVDTAEIDKLSEIAPSKIAEEVDSLVTKIKKEHKEFLKEQAEARDAAERKKRIDDYEKNPTWTQNVISSCPANLFIPSSIFFSTSEIGTQTFDAHGNIHKRTASKNPIVVTQILREPTKHTTQYQIAIKTKKIWRHIVVDGDELADTRKILRLARDGGAIIKDAKLLTNFFAELISANEDFLTETKCYNKTGWTDDDYNFFAYPTGGDDYIVRRAGFDYEKIFKPKGDSELWKKTFVDVTNKGGAVACAFIGIALAAPMAEPIIGLNPQAHLLGKSGGGKTALQKFTASIFGNPRELIRTFAATSKNRMLVADAFNGLPTFIDELETIQGKTAEEALSNDIYNYTDGKGNQANKRDGTAREAFKFNGSRLTTGERPILKQNDLRGAYKRLLQLDATKGIFPDDFAADLHFISEKNFGHFGQVWIQFVVEYQDEIQKKFQHFARFYKNEQKKCEPTLLKNLAAACVAFEFFRVAIGVTTEFDTISCVRNMRAIFETLPSNTEMDDTARAEECLTSFVASHEKYFLRNQKDSNGDEMTFTFTNETYGKIFDTGEVAFFPTALKKILEDELKFASYDKLIAEWLDKGKLNHNPGRKDHGIKIAKKTYKMIHFKANIISTDTDSAETSYYERLGVMDS